VTDPDHHAPFSEQLQLVVTRVPDIVVVAASGEVDMLTAPALRYTVERALLDQPPPAVLVVDLTGITFFGSSGLAAMLHIASTATIPLRIVANTQIVLRPLQLVGASIETYPTRDAALAGALS
jgi:anti-sigma B factor antagonist